MLLATAVLLFHLPALPAGNASTAKATSLSPGALLAAAPEVSLYDKDHIHLPGPRRRFPRQLRMTSMPLTGEFLM